MEFHLSTNIHDNAHSYSYADIRIHLNIVQLEMERINTPWRGEQIVLPETGLSKCFSSRMNMILLRLGKLYAYWEYNWCNILYNVLYFI
jgi:hypothetical protein